MFSPEKIVEGMKNKMSRASYRASPQYKLAKAQQIAKNQLMAQATIAPKKTPSSAGMTLGQKIYRDMNPMGKKVVDTIADKIGYVSPATRAGMRQTNIAGRRGQLGAGWR